MGQESVQEKTLMASLEQILTYRLAESYSVTLSEETASTRRAREAARAARETAATEWMEDGEFEAQRLVTHRRAYISPMP